MRRDAELGTEVGLQKTSCGLLSEIQPALNTASLGLFSPNHSFISSAKEEYSHSKFPAPKNESVCAPEQRVGRWLLGKRQGRSGLCFMEGQAWKRTVHVAKPEQR